MSPVHQVWPNLLARHSNRGKNSMQTEKEVRRQHQGMDRPGVRQVPESSGEQGKMEETGCEIIHGAPATLAVLGSMMMMMRWWSVRACVNGRISLFLSLSLSLSISLYLSLSLSLFLSLSLSLPSPPAPYSWLFHVLCLDASALPCATHLTDWVQLLAFSRFVSRLFSRPMYYLENLKIRTYHCSWHFS